MEYIREGGREEGQESQFHGIFFMQAANIAYNICTAERHSNQSEKRNTFENSIIYRQYNFVLYVPVFVHEATNHTELNIYFNNHNFVVNTSHNINTGV